MIVIERDACPRKRGACPRVITAWERATTIWAWWSPPVSPKNSHPRLFPRDPMGPDAVDLVECHATSNPARGREEVRALKEIFIPQSHRVTHSSQIGHALGRLGINNASFEESWP